MSCAYCCTSLYVFKSSYVFCILLPTHCNPHSLAYNLNLFFPCSDKLGISSSLFFPTLTLVLFSFSLHFQYLYLGWQSVSDLNCNSDVFFLQFSTVRTVVSRRPGVLAVSWKFYTTWNVYTKLPSPRFVNSASSCILYCCSIWNFTEE